MIKPENIKILKTDIPLWPNSKNGHIHMRGIIDKSGEYYEKWTSISITNNSLFRSNISYIDLLRGNIAIVYDNEDYPVKTIKYLGIHYARFIGIRKPLQVWIINNRNICYNRVGWAHGDESSYKIPLSIFEGQIDYGEICDGLQLVINNKYEYDVIEEIKRTEQKNENGFPIYKSIWCSKSADKKLLCVNGKFNKEDLKDLFKK